MYQLLKIGQVVETNTGSQSCRINRLLGGGGQGEVYEAQLDGAPVALKWYLPASATCDQRSALEELIRIGAPNSRFLWPLDLVSGNDSASFGYVMRLRGPQFKGIGDLMKRRVEPSFRALTMAGIQLVESFHELHSKGLCYQDISFGNVFFDPENGEVQICDNDNVRVNGKEPSGVYGTPRFMAPEIVRREALPSTQTDLYSLSVLLFYMFFIHHPLEGKRELAIKCLDLPAMTRLYGTDPLFIFDPHDSSNAPDRSYHGNAVAFWPIYPEFFRQLFMQAFTTGLREAQHGRVAESIWLQGLARLRDSIIYCECGTQNFYDAEKLMSSGSSGNCWDCKRPLSLPPRIRLGDRVVMLNHDSCLFPHHVDPARPYDFEKPVAQVTRHPQNPSLWGLKNLSTEKWVCTRPDGGVQDLEPGRSISLASGTRVNFGSREGEIRQ